MKLALTLVSLFALQAAAKAIACDSGSDSAPLTIQEFVDMECSYCAKGAQTMEEIQRHYPGRVRIVTRNLPLAVHGPVAVAAAKANAAMCLQGASLASGFRHQLFIYQSQLVEKGEPFLYEIAGAVGANVEKLKADMNSDTVAKSLATDEKDAAALGFKGTPAYVIGTETMVGAYPYEEVKKVVDKQLGIPGVR